MFKKIFAILLIPVIIALSVGQGVFADDIQIEGIKVLGDGTSTQTIDGVYDPTSGEIEITQTENIQSGISNQILEGIIDTACAFRDIYCYKDDINKDGKLDYIQLNKATGEIKYYEFAGTDSQLFSAKYAIVDNNLRGTEHVLFSTPSKDMIGISISDNNKVFLATKKGTTYRLTKIDVKAHMEEGFSLDANGADRGQVMNVSLELVSLGNGKKIFKYTGLHDEHRSVSGGDASIFYITGDYEGLKQNHQTLNPGYAGRRGRMFYVGDTSVNIAYNRKYYHNRLGSELIENGKMGINIDNQISLFPNNKMVYINDSGKYHVQDILGLNSSKKSLYHLIKKIDNIDTQFNYYLISVDEGYQYSSSVGISSVHSKTIVIKTDKRNFYKGYKVFDKGIKGNYVITDYSPYTIKIPKVNKVLTDSSLGKALIIYSYNGKVYKIYFDKNSLNIDFINFLSHPNANYTSRLGRGYYGGIGNAGFNFFIDLGNGYYFSNGIIYGIENGDFVVKGYTNITANDIGKPYYDGRRSQKVWQQRGFISNVTNGISEIIYQRMGDGNRRNNYIAGDTIRAIKKSNGTRYVVLGRKDYLDEKFGKSSLNRRSWYHFINNSKHYNYIFDTETGRLIETIYNYKTNPYSRYYNASDNHSERYNSYTYRNDGKAVGVGTSKIYNINGVSFKLY